MTELASDYGYDLEDRNCYRHNADYLMRIGRRVIYLRNMRAHDYAEVKRLLEQRARIVTSPSVIGNALTIGGSALGGALLGYLLLRAGVHPLVMVPSIIVPPCIGMYEMVKQSSKENKKLTAIDVSLEKYKKQIFYDDEAIKRFLCGIHTKAH